MSYQVIYDVTRTRPDLTPLVFGSAFIVVGAVMVYGVRRATTPTTRSSGRSWFTYVFLGFGVLWTCLASSVTVGSWYSSYRAMRDGRTELVEGVVEDFVPMPTGSRSEESFTVAGHAFRYRDGSDGGAFTRSSVHGGPIRAAQRVRIHAVRGAILKLEIERADLAAPVRGVDDGGGGPPAIFAAIPAVTFVWFPFVIFMLSVLSGWRSLARRFPGEVLEGADGYLMQSGRIGFFGSYRNVLNVTIGDDAFGMQPLLPFGLFHHLLVIPWAQVARVEARQRLLVPTKVVTLTEDGREIQLYGESGDAVEQAFERWRAKHRRL